jgi:glycosyltransferase involved in cell wall biosynthesis
MLRSSPKSKGRPLKVGLIIDEYFGAAGTGYGGYGFLARRMIAKYLSGHDLQIDVLLGKGKKYFFAEKYTVEDEQPVNLYRLPRRRWAARHWLKKQNYDIYISIELTFNYVLQCEPSADKKLILWVQDPRPMYEWDEINTVKLLPETCYYNQGIYDTVHEWYKNNRVRFISQGIFLNQKAKDLYNLDEDVNIDYVPNPIEIDETYELAANPKENIIIFLARLESVKRSWLFCEIAKKMPDHQFYVLGKTFQEQSRNNDVMQQYYDIPNLHFAGHVDGDIKTDYLKRAKILVNTSIHEALPISFLEALAFGTLLVSNRNPDDLTSKFGIHVGDVLGDGFDKVDLFVEAIHKILDNPDHYDAIANEAINYIRSVHNVSAFQTKMKEIIKEEFPDRYS